MFDAWSSLINLQWRNDHLVKVKFNRQLRCVDEFLVTSNWGKNVFRTQYVPVPCTKYESVDLTWKLLECLNKKRIHFYMYR